MPRATNLFAFLCAVTAQSTFAQPADGDLRTAGQLTVEATLRQAQGRYSDAEALYRRAFAIREKLLSSDDPIFGASANNLAGTEIELGNYAEAERLLHVALTALDRPNPSGRMALAAALSNLATLCRLKARYPEALALAGRALDLKQDAMGLTNLALIYLALGRLDEAENAALRAVGFDENARTLTNLATVYETQAKYWQAESLVKRSLAIEERQLGPDHSQIGETLNTLGVLYRRQDKLADAEAAYARALPILERSLGPHHPKCGAVLNNLGQLASAGQK